jgi:hypothetical protein
MYKLIMLVVAFIAFTLVVGEAGAVQSTPDKVKEMCGSKLQKGCTGITCAYGCDTKCGDTICTANCCWGPSCGEWGCHIHSVDRTFFGKKIKLPYSAYIRMYGRHRHIAGGR